MITRLTLFKKKIITHDYYKIIDTTIIEKFDDRIKRLATARQLLKDNILQLNLRSKYICVIDLDDVLNEEFSFNLINNLTTILSNNRDKYFGISVSSKPYYYDILNFESDEYLNISIKQLQNNKSIQSYKNRKKYIYDVQHSLTQKKNYECISGFNGLCLYFYDEYMQSNYVEDSDDQTPEHLFFNRNLHKIFAKKILISNNYLSMPKEHKPLNNIFYFIFEKIIKYFNIYLSRLLY